MYIDRAWYDIPNANFHFYRVFLRWCHEDLSVDLPGSLELAILGKRSCLGGKWDLPVQGWKELIEHNNTDVEGRHSCHDESHRSTEGALLAVIVAPSN